MKIEKYMNLAKSLAEVSEFRRQKLGCVVTYKKNVIGTGVNSYKTHPIQKEFNKLRYSEDSTPHCLHAEMTALIPLHNMDIDWNRVNLFVYRIKKDSPTKMGLARPCSGCMGFIKSLGIKDIYYSSEDGYVHEVLDIDND